MVLVSLRLRSSAGVRMSVTIVEGQDDLLSFVAQAEHQLLGLPWDLEDEAAGDRATRWDRSAIELIADRCALLDPFSADAEVLGRIGEAAVLSSEGDVHDEAPLPFWGHVHAHGR